MDLTSTRGSITRTSSCSIILLDVPNPVFTAHALFKEGINAGEITLDEALDVLRRSHEAGLVHMAYFMKGADRLGILCSCCSYCHTLGGFSGIASTLVCFHLITWPETTLVNAWAAGSVSLAASLRLGEWMMSWFMMIQNVWGVVSA